MRLHAQQRLTAAILLFLASAIGVLTTQAEDKKEAPAAAKEKLPEAREVLTRFMKEVGGEEAHARRKSQHAKGTVNMQGQGISGKMEVFAARPNKLKIKIDMAGAGQVTTGFDGQTGWMDNPLTGAMLLPEKAVEQLRTQADFDHALHRPEDYKKAELLGLENFEGEPCYKLQLVHKSGFESTEYFSKATGLQRGFTARQDSPFGEVTVTTVVQAYKKFDGLLMPSKVMQKMSGLEQVMTIDEMEFDTVPPETFELPEAVQALLKEQK